MRFLPHLVFATPILLLPAGACAEALAPVRTVSTIIAQQKAVEWKLAFSGLFVPREEIAVGTALQDQRIAAVEVEVGDYVRAGQVLVRLDTLKLDIRLRENEGRVARARAALVQQEVSREQAQSNLNRTKRLRGNGAVSEQSYDDKLAALHLAEQSIDVAKAELAQAEAQLADAKSERERAILIAPVSGLVSERYARAGALAGNTPLVNLIRDSEIEFAAEVPESELRFLKAGQRVHLHLPDGKDAAGHVRLVSPKIDRQTRLGTVFITLTDKQPALLSGAFGKAEVVFAQNHAILVRDSAVLRDTNLAGETTVFIISNGKAVKRKVELGRHKNGEVEIRSGLQAGDQIIERAGPLLRDGETVSAAPDLTL